MTKANGPATEKGVVIGNVTDKYHTGNPVYRKLMSRFCHDISELADSTGQEDILEAGCGEGHLARLLDRPGRRIRATDFSETIISQAMSLTGPTKGTIEFSVRDIYGLGPEDAAGLVVCCEVLEHLEDPEKAVAAIAGIARPYALFSVPREPLWCILNMARGKYLGQFGNTPGHLNHWSFKAFRRLLETHFTILETRRPLPWSIALCRIRE